MHAVTELEQAAGRGETPDRNSAPLRRRGDGGRARAESILFSEIAESVDLGGNVEWLVVHGREGESERDRKRGARGFLLAKRDDHAVSPRFTKTSGSAERDVEPDDVLQLYRDMLGDVRQVGAS